MDLTWGIAPKPSVKEVLKKEGVPHGYRENPDCGSTIPNICELLRLYIEKEGYEASIANDGEAALKMFVR